MSRRLALLIILGTVLLTARPAAAGHESLSALLPGSALDGSRLFASKGCVGCHGVHGVGGTSGPDLGRGLLNRPFFDIAAALWNHAPGMEHVFHERRLHRPTFDPTEMASLVAFLYYLGSLDPPGDADRGAVLFDKKGCQACHAVGGRGGTVGPALDPYARYASPLFITAALWNRGRPMAAAMEARKIPRPVLEGGDIPDLLAYIRIAAGSAERIYAAPGNPKRGEALFTRKRCAECHAVRGHGGRVGPDLATGLSGSIMRIAGVMWNHGPGMWAKMSGRGVEVPTLSTEELSDLVSYLYFFQFTDAPGDARRGAAVYRDKRCGTCHGAAGSRTAAPAFADVADKLRTPIAVVTAMWNHAGQMTETMAEENVAWPVLRGGEMADLIAYLVGLPRGPGDTTRPTGDAGRRAPRATNQTRSTR